MIFLHYEYLRLPRFCFRLMVGNAACIESSVRARDEKMAPNDLDVKEGPASLAFLFP